MGVFPGQVSRCLEPPGAEGLADPVGSEEAPLPVFGARLEEFEMPGIFVAGVDDGAVWLHHVLFWEQTVELRLRNQPLEIGDSGEVGLERRVIFHPVPRAGVSAA